MAYFLGFSRAQWQEMGEQVCYFKDSSAAARTSEQVFCTRDVINHSIKNAGQLPELRRDSVPRGKCIYIIPGRSKY